jgi:hypothetical protein
LLNNDSNVQECDATADDKYSNSLAHKKNFTMIEQERLQNSEWKQWGPYLAGRQWATVREDYSAGGDAWNSSTHEMARSKAYRWGEEGIGAISDDKQLLCFAPALWNKQDAILKERYFGLTNSEGNHGEDVKEHFYYLDSTPTHSYMKMLYKYPQAAYPYQQLLDENKKRGRLDPEFELIDTGIFNDDNYFDVFVEYAKASEQDILIKISIANRSAQDASLNVLPTLWFRNTWAWGYDDYKPNLSASNDDGDIVINHRALPNFILHTEIKTQVLFCENETNAAKLYNAPNKSRSTKDGINEYIVHNDNSAINTDETGTKAALNYDLTVKAGETTVLKFRLENKNNQNAFKDFDEIFAARINDADEFYGAIQKDITIDDEKLVQRQAFAGMLWSKQFYYYNIPQWLNGDPAQPAPPEERKKGRNHLWMHLNNADIISMPDTWEYPWYAAWDLSFHCIAYAVVDAVFAKKQLKMLTKDWFMHPSGELPAYEWDFDDANPPVHSWATWRVYKIDEKITGKKDIAFLESIFHKLLLNFSWWVNRKDAQGNNIFEGGFLGLDNVGVFNRNEQLPDGSFIEQSDGTAWMAMYALNMMRIAIELAMHNPVYEDMATKFFEHFLYIADAMESLGDDNKGLWDDEDEFYYDVLKMPNGHNMKLKVRSVVGLIPLVAVEVIDRATLDALPKFAERLKWFLNNRPELSNLVSHWDESGTNEQHLLSLLRGHRVKKILQRMLDENEFLSDYGVRSLSKYHEANPYVFYAGDKTFRVAYTPAESDSGMFGGNSNWRGPIWMPVNFLMIESLQRFHHYYGDDFKVEYPTGSNQYFSLFEIADALSGRIKKLFLRNENGIRPAFGENEKIQKDKNFNDHVLFNEYFNGDTGKGLGAAHQTGWTGLIAKLLQPKEK